MKNFSFEKLRVYSDIMEHIKSIIPLIDKWDSCHSIVDHLNRANESILLNLAEGCRSHSAKSKDNYMDYSMGSVLEVAACLDIAEKKILISKETCILQKGKLLRIFKQLFSLKKSWQTSQLNEQQGEYSYNSVFNHEKLDVYQLALTVIQKLAEAKIENKLSSSCFRNIDESATSIVLNIAEGNGRFSNQDHARFISIANKAVTKLVVRIELYSLNSTLDWDVNEIKDLLSSIDKGTTALEEKLKQ